LYLIIEAKEVFNLGMSGETGSKVGATGLSVLLKETNIMAKTRENDAMHQSTEGITDLTRISETLNSVLKD
jgi:hypothetical protein